MQYASEDATVWSTVLSIFRNVNTTILLSLPPAAPPIVLAYKAFFCPGDGRRLEGQAYVDAKAEWGHLRPKRTLLAGQVAAIGCT